jgi:hypothetical protein
MRSFIFFFFLLGIIQVKSQNLAKEQIYGQDVWILPQNIQTNLVLKSNQKYLIKGGVIVEKGSVLSIEKGVVIYAQTGLKNEESEKIASTLIIKENAKILAEGTKESPIVFTSDKTLIQKAQPSDWIGVQIIGKGGESNSGVFKYVRIEYAGEELFDAGDASLMLTNLGKNTVIEYVQSYKSGSEGIRVRSGVAILKKIVVLGAKKHSIRFSHLDIISFDDSFKGGVQFLATYNQEPKEFDDILVRSGSEVVLANITLTGAGNTQIKKSDGFRMKGAQSNLKFTNSIITNFSGNGFQIDEENVKSILLKEIICFDNKKNFVKTTTDYTINHQIFENSPKGTITNIGFIPEKEIKSSSSSQTFNPNFDKSYFVGAFKDSQPENNWTRGWCLGFDGKIVQ